MEPKIVEATGTAKASDGREERQAAAQAAYEAERREHERQDLSDPQKWIGKTVAAVVEDGGYSDMFIRFTDGTAVRLVAEIPSYSDTPDVYTEDWREMAYSEGDMISRGQLVELGLMTQAEVDELGAKWKAQNDARRQQFEREQYERLKAKYGEGP